MAESRKAAGVLSLAEYLGCLAAGDPCPCCGGPMRLDGSALSPGTLGCPACGCEVEAEEWPFRARPGERIGIAA